VDLGSYGGGGFSCGQFEGVDALGFRCGSCVPCKWILVVMAEADSVVAILKVLLALGIWRWLGPCSIFRGPIGLVAEIWRRPVFFVWRLQRVRFGGCFHLVCDLLE